MILRATALVVVVAALSLRANEAVLKIGLLSNNAPPRVSATSLVVVVPAVTLSLKAKEAVLPCVSATSLVVVVAAVTLSLKATEAVLSCIFVTSLVVVVVTTGRPGNYRRRLRLPTAHPSMVFHPMYWYCSLRATNLLVA